MAAVLVACDEADPAPGCTEFTVALPGSGWQWDHTPLAWTGSEYGIAYGVGLDALDLRWATVDHEGCVTPNPDFLSDGPDWGQREKGMVFTGSSFVMVRHENARGSIVTMVDRSGIRLAPDVVEADARGGFPFLVGGEVLITWLGPQVQARDPLPLSLQRFSAAGAALAAPVPVQGLPQPITVARFARNGSGLSAFLFVLNAETSARELHVLRLDLGGRILRDTLVASFAELPDTFAFAVQDDSEVITYADQEGMWLLRLERDGTPGAAIFVEERPDGEYVFSALGVAGDRFLLFSTVFLDGGSAASWIRYLDADGRAFRPTEVALSTEAGGGVSQPTLVSAEGRIGLSWSFFDPAKTDWHYVAQRCF